MILIVYRLSSGVKLGHASVCYDTLEERITTDSTFSSKISNCQFEELPIPNEIFMQTGHRRKLCREVIHDQVRAQSCYLNVQLLSNV